MHIVYARCKNPVLILASIGLLVVTGCSDPMDPVTPDADMTGDPDASMPDPDASPSPDAGMPQPQPLTVASGLRHNCVILPSRTLKCWGRNWAGQLGLGDRESRYVSPALPAIEFPDDRYTTRVATGHDHTCVILDDGSVRCWGHNDRGQLGIESAVDAWGDDLGELASNVPAVDLGEGRTAVEIAAGTVHTCVLLDDETVKCWGAGPYLGLGLPDGTVGIDPGTMGDALLAVELGAGRTVKHIATGGPFTCAIIDNVDIL